MGTHPIFESDFDCLTDMSDLISDSDNAAFHIANTHAMVVYEDDDDEAHQKGHITLRCEIGHECNFQLVCQAPFDSVPSMDTYKEFLYHIQHAHLIPDLNEHNVAPAWSTQSPITHLTSFEVPNCSEWKAACEQYGRIHFREECNWRCRGGELCGHEFADFADYLIHNYYHAHIERITAISRAREVPNECQTPWSKTRDIYKNYKKEVCCRWNHHERAPCEYMCMVPEFLQAHVLNEIDVDWGPRLWKKDQKLTCYWANCEYVVDTRQKGARPLQRLKNHMTMHLGMKKFICTQCNSRFTCVTRLDDHYGRQRREGKKYQCDKCKRIFYTQRLLQSHLRSHTHIYSCPEPGCLQTLPTFTALSAHMRYSHSDLRDFGPCPFCQKKFKSRNDYRAHVQTHGRRDMIKCTMCDFEASSLSKMNYHKRMEHAANNTTVVPGYKCHFCFKVYTRAFKLSKHFRTVHADRNELFTANTGATKHRLKYTLGDDGFYTLEERQKNYESYKHDTLAKNAVDFTKKIIKYQRSLEPDAVAIDERETDEIVERKIYQCQYCSQMYKYQYRQQQHEAQCDLRPDSDFNRLVTRRKRTHESESETDSVPVESSSQERVEFEPDNDEEDTQSSIVSIEPLTAPPQTPLPQPTHSRQIAFANDEISDSAELNISFPQQYPHNPLEANDEVESSPVVVEVKMEETAEEESESRAELIEDGHKRFVKLYNSDGTFKIYKLDDKTS